MHEVYNDEDDVRTGHQAPTNHLHYHKHMICNSISMCLVFMFIHEWTNLIFRYFIVCSSCNLPVFQSLKKYLIKFQDQAVVMSHLISLYLLDGGDNDHHERIGKIDQQPDLHWLDRCCAGEAGGDRGVH